LKENKTQLRSLGVKKLILFGSYARDEQTEDSDIDFLIEFEKSSFDNFIDTLNLLEDLFQKEIDLVEPNLVREELKPSILEGIKYEARI